MFRFSAIILFCLFLLEATGQQQFDFNANCVNAYQAALSLKKNLSIQLIEKEKKTNPNNIVPYFLENYTDFFELFLNEDPKLYQALKHKKKERLDKIGKGPDNSPLKKYMESAIYLQWASVDIKFGNRISAGLGFRDALKTINENRKKFPEFTPNLMISGPVQITASTVPKGYKWLSSMVGISGNMETGQQQMNTFMTATDPWARLFRDEGIFYHCYLQFYLLNQPEEAIAFIRKANLDLVNKHLFTFMAANLCLNNKQSELTKKIVNNRNKSAEYMPTTVWDFELANAHLFHLEPEAEIYFKRFLKNFKGTFYVKDAWMKLAYHHLIHGNMAEYKKAVKMVLTEGKKEVEADKRAFNEAESGIIPNLILLRARLLSDGGYHREALNTLAGKSAADFSKPLEKLEFTYRLGRIYDDLGLDDKAKTAYEATVRNGEKFTAYFAARAALQNGLIYEKEANYKQAEAWYKRCIDMEDHDYENSLEQKAKAGLERCKTKH
jgi:tetratricopeptide (TPR) repeat protein